MSNLVKPVHKDNGIPDWGNTLQSVWRNDDARPWDTYSKEQFSKFWDGRNCVKWGSR